MKATAVLAVAVAVLAQDAAPAAPAAAAVSVAASAPFIGARTGGFTGALGAVRSPPFTGAAAAVSVAARAPVIGASTGGFTSRLGAVRSQPFIGYSGPAQPQYLPYLGVSNRARTAPIMMAASPVSVPPVEKSVPTPEMSAAVKAAHAAIDGQAHDLTVATIDLMAELGTTPDFGDFAILGGLKSAQEAATVFAEKLAQAKAHPEKYDVVQAQLASDTKNAKYLEKYFKYQKASGKNHGNYEPLGVIQDMNSATAAQLTLNANPNDADAQFDHEMAQNDLMSTIFGFKGKDKQSQIFGITSTSMSLPGARTDAAAAQQAFGMEETRLNQIDMEIADLALAGIEADVNSQIVKNSKLAAFMAFTVESNSQKINKLNLERANLVMNGGGNEMMYTGMRTNPQMRGSRMRSMGGL